MVVHNESSLRISAIGMSAQSMNTLRMFFSGPCMNNYVLAYDKNVDVSIIDMDAYNTQRAWNHHHENLSNNSNVLKPISETSINDAVFLRKPVGGEILEVLKLALDKIKFQLESDHEKDTKTFNTKNSVPLIVLDTVPENERQENNKPNIEEIYVEPMLTSRFIALSQKIRQSNDSATVANNFEKEIAKNNENTSDVKLDRNLMPKAEKVNSAASIVANSTSIAEESVNNQAQENKPPVPDKADRSLPEDQPSHVLDNKVSSTPKNQTSDIDKKKSEELTADSELDKSSVPKITNTSIYYDPDDYLQGYLKDTFDLALQEEKDILLEGLLRPVIVLYKTREVFVRHNTGLSDVKNERAFFAFSRKPLAIEKVKYTILTKEYSVFVNEEEGLIFDYDILAWKLTILASRGRIPVGTDLSRQMCLTQQWPDIPELKLTSNTLKIAELWAEKPCTLSMTAQLTGVSQREVFTFFSAARTHGLIEYSNLYDEPEFMIGGMGEYYRKKALQKENVFDKFITIICNLPGFRSEEDQFKDL